MLQMLPKICFQAFVNLYKVMLKVAKKENIHLNQKKESIHPNLNPNQNQNLTLNPKKRNLIKFYKTYLQLT